MSISGAGELWRVDDQQVQDAVFRDSAGPCYCWTLPGATYRVGQFTQSRVFQDEIQNQWRIKFYQGELIRGRVHNAEFELILVASSGSPSSAPRNVKVKFSVFRCGELSGSIGNLNTHDQVQAALGNNHPVHSTTSNNGIRSSDKDVHLMDVSSECKLTGNGIWVKGELPIMPLPERGVLKIYFQLQTMLPLKITTAEETRAPVALSVQKLFMDTRFSDVMLCTTGGISFPAHRNILAARSPYFDAMFTSQGSGNWNNMVEIPEFPESVVRGMLEFIYTDITLISPEFASEWLRISDMYLLEGLKAQVEISLGTNLTVDNVTRIFEAAVTHKAAKLRTRALQFIKMNLKTLKRTDGMKKFALNSPAAMFELFMELTQE